ncbi:hypothetical protein FE782_21125 [Paenibacillus antri]|uniref:SWIM-type domain-containing protein n=1 Tax=Paenibacillus antri TaxID=2582848 RepID=A0A5R9G1G2_9BACL|nr:hypothetical protein [Paenibacillus antri]TLS50177.1 hypothetical protein FE782_21125 [Paenibacillus antri]
MDIRIERGRVTAATNSESNRKEPSPRWDVPIAKTEDLERAARELAADPELDGRWRAGLATEDERERLGAGDRDWRAACDCGQRQPCRHAQSLLFRFRQEAKRDPWLWWEAAGVDRDALESAVRGARAKLAEVAPEAEAAWEARAVQRAKSLARENEEPWMLRRIADPAFWNRDVSFADWLKPIAFAVRAKEEHHDAESDYAMDSHVRERP